MSTLNDRPVGSFDFLLAVDCETTGLSFNYLNPSEGHQAVSWGVIVADAHTFKPIEDLYVEIKWNDTSKQARIDNPTFGKKAESIHGLTFDYLEENGVEEIEAVEQIGSLILKYWGPETSIRTLGHNVHTFDMPFLKAMFDRYGVHLRFGNRHYDSNSLSLGTVGAFNSDDLFTTMGYDQREEHNALDDAHMALGSYRRIKQLWKEKVGVLAYDNV